MSLEKFSPPLPIGLLPFFPSTLAVLLVVLSVFPIALTMFLVALFGDPIPGPFLFDGGSQAP